MEIGDKTRAVAVRLDGFEHPTLVQMCRLMGWVVLADGEHLPVGVEVNVTLVPERELFFVVRLDGVGGPQIVKIADIPWEGSSTDVTMPIVTAIARAATAEIDGE